MAAQIAKPKRKTKTREIIGLATNTDASAAEIARTLNLSEQAVYQSLNRHGIKPKRLESFKQHRADILAAFQQKILKHVDEDRLKKAPAGSLILAACQLYDKERLERGQATQITEGRQISGTLRDMVDLVVGRQSGATGQPGGEIVDVLVDNNDTPNTPTNEIA